MTGVVYSVKRDCYVVKTQSGFINCSAKGRFFKEGVSPVTGDRVELDGDRIVSIGERHSFLPRPPVADFDRLAIVIAAKDPEPSTIVIDKLIAVAESKSIEPILIFNKRDLRDISQMRDIYASAGFATVMTDAVSGEGGDELIKLLKGHFTVFTGNSGVGKSSLLNCIKPSLSLQTGEISRALGRGRHTTRTCEIVEIDDDTLIADTPGFAAVDIAEYVTLYADDLPYAFREFNGYVEKCRFYPSCTHTKEKDCAVKDALERGLIAQSRFNSYLTLYEQVKNNRPWQNKK